MNDTWNKLDVIISSYINAVHKELDERWRRWEIDLSKPEIHEVVGALLARQVALATQLAMSPGIWNAHIAPIILRCMTDVHINLAWIVKDPSKRSQAFILYGLGQQKLFLEHRKLLLTEEGKDPATDPIVIASEAWIDSQRYSFLTEVNVGNWSDLSTRVMAEEAGCLDLYHHAYVPFSAAVHSAWHHVHTLNLRTCFNPLHRYHRVPTIPDLDPELDFFHKAAKYLEKSLHLFDTTFSIRIDGHSAFASLCEELEKLKRTLEVQKMDHQQQQQEE